MVVHYSNFWEEMNHCSDIVSKDQIEFIKRLVEDQKDEGKNFPLTKNALGTWLGSVKSEN